MFFWRRFASSRLELLKAEHAEQCAGIHAAAFAHPWSAGEFAKLISDPATVGAAALDPATLSVRGFALSRCAADEAEILTIAVLPSCRKCGVARDLLREHLQQAAFAGARRIFLEVDADNAAALALYAKSGFVKVGERPGYYRRHAGPPVKALVMRRDLR
ncbi:MAG: GNAT family N-acetyltransferase [Roseiarcus sp.]